MVNRKALLPLCSGVLGVISLALQVTAVATPYWAYFSSDDPIAVGNYPMGIGNIVEEGHYGLWSLCLTMAEGRVYHPKLCYGLRETPQRSFDPGKLRYAAGAAAVTNIILLLIYLIPVPAQLIFLFRNKGVVFMSFRALSLVKIIAVIFGVLCGIAAAVLISLYSNSRYYIRKEWSFALQVVVIIFQIFLFICAIAEHNIGKKFPRAPLTAISQKSVNNAGLQNPAFSMSSPEPTGMDKPHNRLFPITVTTESGKPMTNGPSTKKEDIPKYEYGNTLPVDLTEPGSRKSMQYLEEMAIQQEQPKPKPREKKHRKSGYKNTAYRSSHDSDLDNSIPSVSSNGRNGRHYSTSISSDTATSFSKSTDV